MLPKAKIQSLATLALKNTRKNRYCQKVLVVPYCRPTFLLVPSWQPPVKKV